MKIEKLPSGSYRVRKMYKGKAYSVIFDKKPTQKEAIQAMAEELDKMQKKYKSMTFQAAAEEYIESRRNILSPSTVRGYKTIIKNLSTYFLEKNVHDITALDVQTEKNEMAKSLSPKTVKNRHGFISSVLGIFCPNLKLTTTLPQKIKKEPYIPTDDDVRKILDYSSGTMFEIPIILGCYGLRRSEICALSLNDIKGDIIKINKNMVQDENKNWIIKITKTPESTREVIIPEDVAKKIIEQGYVYDGHPNSITCFLYKAQRSMGLPKFSLHKMRHYFASKMSSMNIPEADIIKMGGWKTDHVMKTVYRHSMMDKDEQAKRKAAEKLRREILDNPVTNL